MRVLFLCVVLTGCDLAPLSREQLVGPALLAAPDAGAPDTAAAPDLAPAPDAAPPDLASPDVAPPEGPPPAAAPVSGAVVSACPPKDGLDALVGIDGQHTCSIGGGKASYYFRDVTVGRDITITAYKKGYRHFSRVVRVPATGLPLQIELEPEAGCAAPPPATEPCRCPPAPALCRPS